MNSQASRSRARLFATTIRPQLTILPWLVYAIVVIVDVGFDFSLLILGSLLFIATYGIVTIHNDLSDAQIDRANRRKDIPLVGLMVEEGELRKLFVALLVVSLIVASLMGSGVLLWVAAYTFLGWLYSGPVGLKNKGYLAVIVLGICYGVMPWGLAFLVTGQTLGVPSGMLIASSFLFTAGIMPLKDFKDVEGDAKHGKRTILVARGPRFTQRFVMITTAVAYVCIVPLVVEKLWLAGIGFILLGMNTILLMSQHITRHGTVRAKHGNVARAGYYLYVLLVYAFIVA